MTQFYIYCIEFSGSVKKYVGSTSRWPKRKKEHLRSLRSKRHANRYLQRAFEKYGEGSITFRILEVVDNLKRCLQRETFWISNFNSAHKIFGYNLVPFATRGTLGYKFTQSQRDKMKKVRTGKLNTGRAARGPANFLAKTFSFFAPSGVNITTTNLKDFARNNNLNYNKLLPLVHGKTISYDGWKLEPTRSHRKIKEWIFISPEGNETIIVNLRQHCLSNNLDYSSMRQLATGKISSCLGWKSLNSRPHKGKTVTICNPEGQIVEINNLSLFCKNNGISYETIRKKKESKGWSIVG